MHPKHCFLTIGFCRHDWSSQPYTELKQLWNLSLIKKKKFRPEWDSNPWPLKPVQCSTMQLSYQATWEMVTLWVRNVPLTFSPHLSYHSPQLKYMIFHLFTWRILHHLWIYYELTKWPAPSWLDSSVGSVDIAEVMGSKYHSGRNFFHPLMCINCDGQSCRHIFLRNLNIWSFIYSVVRNSSYCHSYVIG